MVCSMGLPLESAEFDNFKGLGKVTVRFSERLSVLIGANGVGKSSVLQGIERMSHVRWDPSNAGKEEIPEAGALAIMSGGRYRARYFGSLAQAFSLEGLRGRASAPVTIVLRGADKRSLRVTLEDFGDPDGEPRAFHCELIHKDHSITFTRPGNLSGSEFFQHPDLALFGSRLLRLELGNLTSHSRAPTAAPELDSDGYNLPSVLYWLAGKQRKRLDQLEANVRSVVPDFETTEINPVKLPVENGVEPGQALSVIFRHGERLVTVPAEQVSEGTLLILGVLATAYSPTRPRILLIEDLDRGLHPGAQKAFIQALRGILDSEKDLQIIATTHSPYLLDHFAEPEVIVLKRNKPGVVAAKRFSEHPKWRTSEPVMAVGEFWSAVGEDWVFGDAD